MAGDLDNWSLPYEPKFGDGQCLVLPCPLVISHGDITASKLGPVNMGEGGVIRVE
jgi:hypothetical protein